MADLTNSAWSETDTNNTQPAPTGFPAGILPSQVGGTIRTVMGATKRFFNHINAIASSTGTGNAYVLTYEQPLQNGYTKGEVFRFFAHAKNTGAATLRINDASARALLRRDSSVLVEGDIAAGQVFTVVCDGTNFLVQNTASNFKPELKADLAGAAFTGPITVSGSTVWHAGNKPVATSAQIWLGDSYDPTVAPRSLYEAQAFQTMTSNQPNFAAGINFMRTRSGAETLAEPTGMRSGQSGTIRLDGPGALTFSTAWDFGTSGAPTPSTATGTYDYLDYQVVLPAGGARSIRAFYSKAVS